MGIDATEKKGPKDATPPKAKLLNCGHTGPEWCGCNPETPCPYAVKGKNPCKK